MGDDGGDTRPVRRRAEAEAAEAVSGQSFEGEADQGNTRDVDWLKPAIGVGALAVIVLGYVIVLPIPLIFLEARGAIPSGTPLYDAIEILVAPLTWLTDHSEAYDYYIEWLGKRFY